jgi:hypothetical protein
MAGIKAKKLRALLCVPKAVDITEDMRDNASKVVQWMAARLLGDGVMFTLDLKDTAQEFEASFSASRGDWNRWPRDVLERKDFLTGRPTYDIVIVYCDVAEGAIATVGKTTGDFGLWATRLRRPVIFMDGAGNPYLPSISVRDEDDYGAYWLVSRRKPVPVTVPEDNDNDLVN